MEKSNITEELIRFFIETIKNLERENAELREKIQLPEKIKVSCDYYHGYCWGTKECEKCSCRGIKKYCNFY